MNLEIYHGCHNSFVITDDQENMPYENNAKTLCNKYQTDGFIAVIILLPNKSKATFEMLYYNKDGSRAPMCGNGIRCMMHYCYLHNYIKQEQVLILTPGGIMETKIVSINPFLVSVNLKKPSFDPKILSIDYNKKHINQPLKVKDKIIYVTSIFLGTHHCVVFVDDIHDGDNIGQYICHHPFYKADVNVNFAKIIDENNIEVKTYERGVGWTLACGTGGCSVFAVANLLGKCKDHVTIHFIDGTIQVSKDKDGNIIMVGPSEKIK